MNNLLTGHFMVFVSDFQWAEVDTSEPRYNIHVQNTLVHRQSVVNQTCNATISKTIACNEYTTLVKPEFSLNI